MFPEANRAGLIGDAFNLARCVVLGKLYMYDAPIDVFTAGLKRSTHMREIGVRSPVGTDLCHCQTFGNKCECQGYSEMAIIKGIGLTL